MKVLCIGEILIDFTPRLDIANSYVANPGGAPANVAVSVQRCGGQAGFLGKTGDDAFGKMLTATLEKGRCGGALSRAVNKSRDNTGFRVPRRKQ